MLIQNYSSMKVEIATPKFDKEMHQQSQLKHKDDKDMRNYHHKQQVELINIC